MKQFTLTELSTDTQYISQNYLPPLESEHHICLSQFSWLVINSIIGAIGLATIAIGLVILLTTPVIGPVVAAVGATLGVIGLFNAYRQKSHEESITSEAGNLFVPSAQTFY